MLWFSAKGKPQSVVEDYYADATQKEWLQRSPKCLDFYFLCSHCYANNCIQLEKKKRTWYLRQLKWKTLISGLKNTRREIDNVKANGHDWQQQVQ